MTEIQIDERAVKALAINHYKGILVKTELLLQYADFEGLSIMEAVRDIMRKIRKLEADLKIEQK